MVVTGVLASLGKWAMIASIAGSCLQIVSSGFQLGLMLNLLNNLVNGDWILKQARKFGFYFDQLLIKYANQIYNYFTEVLNGTLFTKDVIDHFTSRAYILVGIFIFFKLCIIAIKYIASPEQFLDSKTGGEQLIKRILFGSLIIIALPLIFDIAMGIQSAIIKDNVIEKLLLPDYVYEDLQRNKGNEGKRIGMTILSGLFGWNSSVPHDSDYLKYQLMLKNDDPNIIDYKSINDEYNGAYKFSYVPIVSTLAIGYFLLTLIRYTMEIVYRSIKLLFLQVIAPFSIVKYMLDPSDNDSLKKWLNTTISTYILIFIRMLTLWFIAMMTYYLKNGIPSSDGTVSLLQSDTDGVLKALIVLGMFAFLKELPKLISELFGYNLQDNEAIGGILNQATGAIKGWATGVVGMKTMKDSGMYTAQIASSIGSGVAGAGSAVASVYGAGKGWTAIGNALSAGAAPVANSLVNMQGQMISSNFGNSALGPVTRETQFIYPMSPTATKADGSSSDSEAEKARRAGYSNGSNSGGTPPTTNPNPMDPGSGGGTQPNPMDPGANDQRPQRSEPPRVDVSGQLGQGLNVDAQNNVDYHSNPQQFVNNVMSVLEQNGLITPQSTITADDIRRELDNMSAFSDQFGLNFNSLNNGDLNFIYDQICTDFKLRSDTTYSPSAPTPTASAPTPDVPTDPHSQF